MKFGEIVLFALVIFSAFSSIGIYAQISKSPQKILSSNDASAPFKENETTIAEVKFSGLDSDFADYNGSEIEYPVYESDFNKFLTESRATISAGEKFNSLKVEKVLKLLKEWLTANGYLKAEVVALGEKLPENQMRLIFSVKRGEIARVSEIRFVGNKNFTSEELIENLKQCSDDGWEIFGERKYEYYALKCVLSLIFSKGYLEGRIKRITPRIVSGNYVVTIEVEEGIRYRIGEIKVEGAKAFTEKELLEKLELKTGDVADSNLLQDFVYEKLKKIYADKGYVDYNGEFDPQYIKPQIKGLDATVNIPINIDEGQKFKLANIKFVGVEKEKMRDLREFISLKDGDVFNRSEFEKGIQKINDTKEFEPIDIDKDVEMRVDEETPEIYIVVKLTEIE